MLTMDQCFSAHRPLTFVIAESDLEVLTHINETYKGERFYVYSSSLTSTVELNSLLKEAFAVSNKAHSTTEVLETILKKTFPANNKKFDNYIFLDCESYVGDKQNIRLIKDILSRYQLQSTYTVNLTFISQSVCVPPQLERLSEVVIYDLPSEKELKRVSDEISASLDLVGDKAPSDEVISNLRGLTKFEVEQSFLQSYAMHKGIDLNFVRDFKKSSIAKTDLLELLESNVTFDDIGGMPRLKSWIDKSFGGWTVEGREYGLPLLKGLLLVGLPGCGKTLVSKALGNQWGLPVIQFDPSRVFSSRVGDSENNIRRVLKIIENISPCVLFIDEIEKGFAGMQSSSFSDAGVTARVIGSFLIWLQECEKPVFTVATSNAIHYLPPELISRFDETFFVNLPMFAEREDIFKIHIAKVNRDPEKFGVSQLAQASQDLSGREIEQCIREAMYDSFHDKKELSTEHILTVLARKTNLLTTMAEQLNYILKWVGYDEKKDDGVRARFASPAEEGGMKRIQDQIEDMLKEIEGSKPPDMIQE